MALKQLVIPKQGHIRAMSLLFHCAAHSLLLPCAAYALLFHCAAYALPCWCHVTTLPFHKCTHLLQTTGALAKHAHRSTTSSWPLLAAGWWGTTSPASCSPCSGQSLLMHSALDASCVACGCCCAAQCHTPAPCPGRCPACATAIYYITYYSKAIIFTTYYIL